MIFTEVTREGVFGGTRVEGKVTRKDTFKDDVKSSTISSWVVRFLLATLGVSLIFLAFIVGYVSKVVWSQYQIKQPNPHGQQLANKKEAGLVKQGGSFAPLKDSNFKTFFYYPSSEDVVEVTKGSTAGDRKIESEQGSSNIALPDGIRQHLYFDFQNMDSTFLTNKERVSQAAEDVIRTLFLNDDDDDEDDDDEEEDDDEEDEGNGGRNAVPLEIKQNCSSSNKNKELSCVNVFHGVEGKGFAGYGNLFFYTFPSRGVMVMDLFYVPSSEEIDVANAVDAMKELFGIPDDTEVESSDESHPPPVVMDWGNWYRGFNHAWDENPDIAPPLARSKDLGKNLYGFFDTLKKVVASVETPFQQIDIVDNIDPRYQSLNSYYKSLQKSVPSYESQHPELFAPRRSVYLDGVLQSTSHGDEEYHEALVHPGMLAHDYPKRAAIIGGGEGATLREILRHDTIEHVKMIEIDGTMVNASRAHLPNWNSCADIAGSTPNCFDEPRADVRIEDALAWFINRFGPNASIEGEDKFDVVIMDALDPQDNVAFASALYSNDDFTESLYNSLTSDGVLIMQLGEVPSLDDLPDEYSKSHMRASLEQDLIRFGFKSLHQYDEAQCDFEMPWSYIVAFKSEKTRKNWYENESLVDMKIQKRLRPRVHPKTGEVVKTGPLRFFDGATMATYQVPHKAFETIFCRSPFAPSDICASTLLKPSKSLLHLPPNTWNLIEKNSDVIRKSSPRLGKYDSLKHFVETFGTKTELLGDSAYDVSINALVEKAYDHFCRWNEDCNFDSNATATILADDGSATNIFNPVIARRLLPAVATA